MSLRYWFPGGWYVDALPNGAFVVLYPGSHFDTHLGRVELPPGEPWGIGYVRCTGVGGFRFAGQAHSSTNPAAWEYIPYPPPPADANPPPGLYGWHSFPPPCVGVSPCIYDLLGTLHRSDGAIGSQGYRYVQPDGTSTGLLVSGDATYRYPTGQLYEYSAAGDIWIGQAAYDGGGVQVLTPDGILRQLEVGATTFVRVQVDGMCVAVSFKTDSGAVVIQTTMAELRALPPVVTTPPVEPPVTPPTNPEPPTEPAMDYFAINKSVRAKYPTPLGARHWEYLVDLAQQTGTLLYEKPAGDNCYVPPIGKYVSLDVVGRGTLGNQWADVLADAEGEAVPTWSQQPNAAGVYLDVSGVTLPGDSGGGEEPPAGGNGMTEADVRRIVAEELAKPRKVALKTENGHYVCAESGGGADVNATRTSAGGWETFTQEAK